MSLRRSIVIASVVASLMPCAAGAMGIEKGVKAGVNLASFRGEFADLADAKIRTGFVGGAFVAFGFAPDLAVQVEALFSQKGAKFESVGMDEEGNPTGQTYDTFVKVNYLEVPVLLRGTLLRGAPVQPRRVSASRSRVRGPGTTSRRPRPGSCPAPARGSAAGRSGPGRPSHAR
jgi:hypothetical protein